MGRYEDTRIKKSNIVRGKDNLTRYNNILSYKTTIYSFIPESDDDIWVITQNGDRLDNLAYQYYGDSNLWWYLAKANNLNFMTLSVGTSLRIPATTKYAVGT